MKKTFLYFALAALAPASALAQGTTGKFYIDWDSAAKKCVVTETRPTNPNNPGLRDFPPYNSKAAAEAALPKVNGCETPMK